ncbi:heme exporter protein CcmD [Glaciecola siphonariae]|uniref:Heme exporter protein D n=1 Tax=Glaciecola siphonariae TaxID=521012 RepID=A0ABV9LUA0_9ALTE
MLHRIPGRTIALILGLILACVGTYFMWGQGVKFQSFDEFIDMGQRGLFVWLSYSVSLVAMLALLFQSQFMNKAVKDYVAKQQARAQKIIAAREKRRQTKTGVNEEQKA